MTEALKIPGEYANALPETIAELQAQQEYFNQLEIAAQKIQKATKNYNELLEQGLTAIPINNVAYNGENTEISEVDGNYKETTQMEEAVVEENIPEETVEYQDEVQSDEIAQNEVIETTEQEQIIEDNPESNTETNDSGPKINLNSLLNKEDK